MSDYHMNTSFSPRNDHVQTNSVTVVSMFHTMSMMIWRDLWVTLKQFHSTLALLLIQPAMLLLVLGRIQEMTGSSSPSYINILFPGILASIVVSVSIHAVSGPLTVEFSYTLEIEDRLLSPIPIWIVGVEKIVVGMLKALMCGLLYFPLAWVILGPELYHPLIQSPAALLGGLALSSFAMSALGLWLGSITDGPQSSVVYSVLLVPMSFLGCVFFSWLALGHAPLLQYLTLLDPQTYVSELFRATLTNTMHMVTFGIFSGLIFWCCLFLILGLRAFIKRSVK